MNTIKLVTSIERTECRNLYGMKTVGFNKIKIPTDVIWEKIAVRAFPSLSVTDKIEDKVHIYTSTLKFYSCIDFADRKSYAYRIKMIDGTYKMIGGYHRPIPIMTVQESAPEKASDNQWNEVSIVLESRFQLPTITF